MLFLFSFTLWRQVRSCSPLTWSHDWGPSPVLGNGIEVINIIPREARDGDYHFNLLTIYQSSDLKQQQRGVPRRTGSLQNFKIVLPEKKGEWTKFRCLGINLPLFSPLQLCSASAEAVLCVLCSGDSKWTAGSQSGDNRLWPPMCPLSDRGGSEIA